MPPHNLADADVLRFEGRVGTDRNQSVCVGETVVVAVWSGGFGALPFLTSYALSAQASLPLPQAGSAGQKLRCQH